MLYGSEKNIKRNERKHPVGMQFETVGKVYTVQWSC